MAQLDDAAHAVVRELVAAAIVVADAPREPCRLHVAAQLLERGVAAVRREARANVAALVRYERHPAAVGSVRCV